MALIASSILQLYAFHHVTMKAHVSDQEFVSAQQNRMETVAKMVQTCALRNNMLYSNVLSTLFI